MKQRGRKDGFDRMANGVPEVDEVAEPGLALVDGDDVRLDADGPRDDREQQLLCGRARGLGAAGEVGGRRLDGGEDLGGARFERCEFFLVPYRGGL